MAKVGLVGPYNQTMKNALYQCVPAGFEIIEAPRREDFSSLTDVKYIINRTLEIGEEELALWPNLRLISKYAVGFDNLNLTAAGQRNIPILNCRGANTESVAELTLTLMLAVYRNLIPLYSGLIENQWLQDCYTQRSYTLKDKTVGIIGLGSIGGRVAQLVQAFGSKVVYYDAFRRAPQDEAAMDVTFLPLDDLFAESDIVTIHCPGSAENTHLINKKTLSLMKPSAVLINCSRGTVVNEADLLQALTDGTICAAGLDVFEVEPPVDNPLLKLPNVVATPHVAGSTNGLGASMIQLCMKFIVDFETGNPLPRQNIVNYKYLADPSVVGG